MNIEEILRQFWKKSCWNYINFEKFLAKYSKKKIVKFYKNFVEKFEKL